MNPLIALVILGTATAVYAGGACGCNDKCSSSCNDQSCGGCGNTAVTEGWRASASPAETITVKGPVKNGRACLCQCQFEDPRCRLVAFNFTSQHCVGFTGRANPQLDRDADIVLLSDTEKCVSDDTDAPACGSSGGQAADQIQTIQNSGNANNCRALCRVHPRCVAAEFNKEDGKCSLKPCRDDKCPPVTSTWSINAEGVVSRTKPDGTSEIVPSPAGVKFVKVSGKRYGEALATATNDAIYYFSNGQWTQMPGSANRPAIGTDGSRWVVNSGNVIYQWVNNAWRHNPVGSAKGIDVFCEYNNRIAVTGTDSNAYQYNGAGGWTVQPGKSGCKDVKIDATAITCIV